MFGKNISRPYRLSDKYFYSKYFQTIHVVWSNTIFTPLYYNLQSTNVHKLDSALFLCLFSGRNFVSRHYILNITFSILCLQALHSQHALDPHQSDMCPTHSLSPYQGLQFKNLHTFTIFDTFLSVALSWLFNHISRRSKYIRLIACFYLRTHGSAFKKTNLLPIIIGKYVSGPIEGASGNSCDLNHRSTALWQAAAHQPGAQVTGRLDNFQRICC